MAASNGTHSLRAGLVAHAADLGALEIQDLTPITSLTGGIEVDLDAPLSADDE